MGTQAFEAAIMEYDLLGFDTFPLISGSKKPAIRGWQNQPSHRLWQQAPPNANIAIRGGGEASLAVIDCDEKNVVGTFDKVRQYLATLGYLPDEYPIVQSASGNGRHIYVQLDASLDGHYRELSPEFGAGEFRYGSGSYVTAVPSIIEGKQLVLLSGDFRNLAKLDIDDVLPLINNKNVQQTPTNRIPRRTFLMLKGEELDGYKTRSHAEQAIMVGLINAEFGFIEIVPIFQKYEAAGKYQQLLIKNSKQAQHYLETTYKNALDFATQNESTARQTSYRAMVWAENRAWSGRSGSVDRAVFTAHAHIAHRSGKFQYAASSRELAELSGYGRDATLRATYRLISNNMLNLVKKSTTTLSNVYSLRIVEQIATLPIKEDVRECRILFQHDAFRHGGGLGKSALEVYEKLLIKSETVKDLADMTGRHPKTVGRVLKQMSEKLIDIRTGGIVSMVQNTGKKWKAIEVDLDQIAAIVGTAGTLEAQKKKHNQERELHRQRLLRGIIQK